MQAIRCPRAPAGAKGSTGSSNGCSSSSNSSSSSRHQTAHTQVNSSTWLGAATRRSALLSPALRIHCSRIHSRVHGVPPLRDQQAHELPSSWRRSLNSHQTEAAGTTSSSTSRANGRNKHESSSNSGPVQSFQALFQQHAAGAGSSSSSQRLASLRFSIVRAVDYGQKLRLVGSPDCLGAWDAAQGPDMKWHEGHKWTACAELAAGSHEFKFVVVHRSGQMEWEPGSNRVLDVPATAAEMQVSGQWGETGDTETLELLQQPSVSEGRRCQQQLVEAAGVAAAAGTVEPAAAVAAAKAADALWSVLDLDQQSQMQPPPRDSAADAAAVTAGGVSQQQIDLLLQVMKAELGSARSEADAAAAATAAVDAAAGAGNGVPTPQQIQQLMQALREELSPSAAAAAAAPAAAASDSNAAAYDSSSSILMSSSGAAADVVRAVQLDAQLAAHNNKLVSMLLEMRTELVSGINDVTVAMQEVQEELAEVQQQVAQLATERWMMMMQQQQLQQQGLGPAAAAAVAAAAALEGAVDAEHGDAAAWREVERQLMAQQAAEASGTSSSSSSSSTEDAAAAAAGTSGQSSWRIKWKDGNSSSSSSSINPEPVPVVAAVVEPAAGSRVQPSLDLDFAGPAAVGSLAGNLQLSPAMLTWRQEVLQFRQESKILCTELQGLNAVLDSMQQQLVANTAAIHGLQDAVLSDESSSAAAKSKPQATAAADLASAVAAAAAEAGEMATGSSSTTGGSQLQEQLLEKFNQLAVDLKEEVKHAVEAVAAAKQQPQGTSQQPFSFDDFVSQLWTAPPPQELKRQQQQNRKAAVDSAAGAADSSQQQQGRHSSSSSAAREEAAAAAKLLDSHNVQQYHKGLLVCVMMAAGVWEEGLLDIIRGSAMRATWRAYKAVWTDELMSELKQQLTTPQAVLAELQHSSSAADELASHVLWSLQELSTHSTRVALLLKQVYSGQEAALMQQLEPDAAPQPCAAVLLRWMAAAAKE